MKKIILCLSFLLLEACRTVNYFESNVSRNQIYYGQTTVNLFDNFGRPKKMERYANDVCAFVFMHEDIIKKGTDNYLNSCNLRVYTRYNRVIDWDYQGNNCQFTVDKETKLTLFDDEEYEEES